MTIKEKKAKANIDNGMLSHLSGYTYQDEQLVE